jgi:CDP-diacylglycerol--glycerol-3-phosphate 3-phosphatidyltransferase
VTLANKITLLRVALIPVFLVLISAYSREREWLRSLALGVYAVAAISDILDGYLARRWNQRSLFGARLDPLADKLIVNLGFVFLAANEQFAIPAPQGGTIALVPLWFPVVILSRDIIIVMGAYTINEFFGPVKIKPRWSGKVTTMFQMSTMIGVLLGVGFSPYLILATVFITVLSLLDYVYVGCVQAFAKGAE